MGFKRFKEVDLHYNEVTRTFGASTIAVGEPCIFRSILVNTDGTNNITLNIYDNLAASGKRLCPTDWIILGTSRTWIYSPELLCNNGVYVEVTTSGAVVYQVIYDVG